MEIIAIRSTQTLVDEHRRFYEVLREHTGSEEKLVDLRKHWQELINTKTEFEGEEASDLMMDLERFSKWYADPEFTKVVFPEWYETAYLNVIQDSVLPTCGMLSMPTHMFGPSYRELLSYQVRYGIEVSMSYAIAISVWAITQRGWPEAYLDYVLGNGCGDGK